MRLNICSWLWGEKYGVAYINRLFAGVGRNLTRAATPWMFAPCDEDMHLTQMPGCFARLRMFDPDWQERQGFERGDRIVCLDLDLVITGSLDGLFDGPEPFTILQGVNSSNPCPFNGSVWATTAGYRPDVWTDFSLEAARAVPFDSFPDDQAWLAHKMPDAAAFGPQNGVYAFKKPGWPKGDALPADARIVAFPGHRDPSQFQHLPWVRRHWLAEPAFN